MQSYHADQGGSAYNPLGDAGAMLLDHPAKRPTSPAAPHVVLPARVAALGRQLRVAFAAPADHPFGDLLAAIEFAEGAHAPTSTPGRSRLRRTPAVGHRPEFELA